MCSPCQKIKKFGCRLLTPQKKNKKISQCSKNLYQELVFTMFPLQSSNFPDGGLGFSVTGASGSYILKLLCIIYWKFFHFEPICFQLLLKIMIYYLKYLFLFAPQKSHGVGICKNCFRNMILSPKIYVPVNKFWKLSLDYPFFTPLNLQQHSKIKFYGTCSIVVKPSLCKC